MIEVFERQLYNPSEVEYLRQVWPVRHVTIAIPAYNEERFIGSVVIQALRRAKDVIVIDDGSQDSTAFIAEKAGAQVLHHVVNMGKTEAVNTALSWARQHGTDLLVFIDGDGQHNPEEIEQVMEPVISGQADMVVGSRFLQVKSEIPLYRKVGQHALTRVTNMASAAPTTDSQSGFRAFSRRAIETLDFRGTGLSVESEMQFQAREHGLIIKEVSISVVYAEKAKRNPVAHGMQIITNILRLVSQHRPLFFFGLMSVIFLAIGSFMGVVTIDIFMNTHILADGYALISVLMLILGAVTLFVGLILHSVHSSFEEIKRTLVRERAFDGR